MKEYVTTLHRPLQPRQPLSHSPSTRGLTWARILAPGNSSSTLVVRWVRFILRERRRAGWIECSCPWVSLVLDHESIPSTNRLFHIRRLDWMFNIITWYTLRSTANSSVTRTTASRLWVKLATPLVPIIVRITRWLLYQFGLQPHITFCKLKCLG